jgi:para-aminobenzoate synthetase component 1
VKKVSGVSGSDPREVFAAVRGAGPAVLLETAASPAAGAGWGGGVSYVAFDPVRVHVVADAAAAGPDALACVRDLPPGRRLFGWIAYDAGRLFERLPARPPRDPAVPDILLLECDAWLEHDGAAWRSVGAGSARLPRAAGRVGRWTSGGWRANLDAAAFEGIVRRAKDLVAAGDIYQVNLSLRLEAACDGDPFDLYRRLTALNPAPHAAFVEAPDADVALVSSSPERLVRVAGDRIETRPIAGTYRRDEDPATLPRDPKERAEHVMLVDLERNDIGRVCLPGTVEVERLLAIESYSHVHHLVSTVAGRLRPGAGPVDVIRAVFPGGTITGCPKVRSMEVIDDLEPVARGPYTGSIGWIDGSGDLDLSIIIRTVVAAGGRAFAQAGAGIVADSRPGREHAECLAKAAALVEAAGWTFIR